MPWQESQLPINLILNTDSRLALSHRSKRLVRNFEIILTPAHIARIGRNNQLRLNFSGSHNNGLTSYNGADLIGGQIAYRFVVDLGTRAKYNFHIAAIITNVLVAASLLRDQLVI